VDNYSILERNTLDGFSEPAGILYLKLLDVFQGDERRAFIVACRYEDRFAALIDYILRNMPGPLRPNEKTRRDLFQFFTDRWRHNFMERQNVA
jgi:hypothetical protein